jgi:uncharacterized membrane protein YeaQ/YmgE (transglycosylase-associated protein family)
MALRVVDLRELPLTTPGLIFALLCATLLGALTHFVVGGAGQRLILLVIASWCGFAFGQVIGSAFRIETLTIGTVHLLPALLSAGVVLTLTAALSSPRNKEPKRRRSGR